MTTDIDILKDERVNCSSVMIQLNIEDYLDMVRSTFENRGSLEGQRETLKTSTAIRIRKRMVQDLESGAVLPPIVLGVIVPNKDFLELETLDKASFLRMLKEIPHENISIIDGMQRTTALIDALNNQKDIGKNKIRIEYWIASDTNSLTYRMLVLNTGQIPWNLRRQIEIVFRSIIKKLQHKLPEIEIMEINEERRRSKPGQFQAGNIIELFLVFGARKEKIDIQKKLADEFTRQDFIESTANLNFTNIFYEVIDYLVKFDITFASFQDENIKGNFQEGKDLFSSQPACVGFVTAIALSVLGRPGFDYSPEKQNKKWNQIKNSADQLLQRLSNINSNEIGYFLDLQTLNELIRHKKSKTSYFEREFFLQAFKVLIEEDFALENMTPCWRAL